MNGGQHGDANTMENERCPIEGVKALGYNLRVKKVKKNTTCVHEMDAKNGAISEIMEGNRGKQNKGNGPVISIVQKTRALTTVQCNFVTSFVGRGLVKLLVIKM